MLKLAFHGHSCFTVTTGENSLVIDPWLENNPLADINWQEVSVSTVLLTHGHFDHIGDALKIAEKCNATIIAVSELATYCEKKGAKVERIHIGGSRQLPFCRVKYVPAWHSSSVIDGGNIIYAGTPAGIILNAKDLTIYHAGDTGIFGDMRLIGDMHKIDVALLPIGDGVTMGIDDAVVAVKMLKPKMVVPMHYNSFPAIIQNPEIFKQKILEETKCACVVMKPGDNLSL